jgi:hypothetical protein
LGAAASHGAQFRGGPPPGRSASPQSKSRCSAQSRPRCDPQLERRGTTDTTDPVEASMAPAQCAALSALIHSPATLRTSVWKRPDRSGDVAWAAVLALFFGLSVLALSDGLRFVRSADTLQALAAARAPVGAPGAQGLAERRQPSAVTRRTM